MARLDPHSHADTSQPQVDFLDWQADVDFNTRGLDCVARLIVRSAPLQASLLDLDTRYLDIATVTDADGKDLTWSLAPPEPILGSRLRVELPAGTQSIDIRYRTLPDADAVQWLEEPEPFLYTQCQPIHARSVVPLQDTPRTRLRFQAELRIPKHLKALMAAEALGRESSDEFAIERFRMPQPIAPYLFALAVGNLASRDVGPRSRVWAHPELVDSAAWEFADTEHLLSTGEALFGPYDWDRYDLLVLPPFFPYGGM